MRHAASYRGGVPHLDALLAFALASHVLVVIPGPSVLFVVGRSLTLGHRGGVVRPAGLLAHVVDHQLDPGHAGIDAGPVAALVLQLIGHQGQFTGIAGGERLTVPDQGDRGLFHPGDALLGDPGVLVQDLFERGTGETDVQQLSQHLSGKLRHKPHATYNLP